MHIFNRWATPQGALLGVEEEMHSQYTEALLIGMHEAAWKLGCATVYSALMDMFVILTVIIVVLDTGGRKRDGRAQRTGLARKIIFVAL